MIEFQSSVATHDNLRRNGCDGVDHTSALTDISNNAFALHFAQHLLCSDVTTPVQHLIQNDLPCSAKIEASVFPICNIKRRSWLRPPGPHQPIEVTLFLEMMY